MSIDFSQNRPHRSQQPRSASANFVGRIAGQSALLLAGFATAQGASFLRNALIGRYLSPTDFGIAASITLALQLVEILSDLGADRLIVRSEDGDTPAMMATVHAVLLTRGFLTAALLYTVAAPLTAFLRITESLWAFEIIALVPAIKGFMHIDCRRRQRHLDNRPFLLVDSATQVAALLLAIPIITLTESYAAIVWIMLFQSVLAVTTSHLVATRPYQISLDTSILKRLILFGYPILLSAFPLVAVYQGERLLVGRMFGMGELAAYSAAFMITMVPSLIAAKIGQAVMLPLLSAVQKQRRIFAQRFQVMCEIAVAAAAGYLMLFIVAGDKILTLTFGPNYSDMGALLTCFALMWALRIVQAVPGMAMMAKGKTGPLLTAGIIRALALIPAIILVNQGYGVLAVAGSGYFGELASLSYLYWTLNRQDRNLGRMFAGTSALLLPVAAIGYASTKIAGIQSTTSITIFAGIILGALAATAMIAAAPATRAALISWFARPHNAPAPT